MTTLWQSLQDIFDPWSYWIRVRARIDLMDALAQLHADRITLQSYGFDDYEMKLYQDRLMGIEQRCSKLEQF